MMLEKQPPRPRAVRAAPFSRNSPAAGPEWWLLSVKDQGTVMAAPFTIAKVVPAGGGVGTRVPALSSPGPRETPDLGGGPPGGEYPTRGKAAFFWGPGHRGAPP